MDYVLILMYNLDNRKGPEYNYLKTLHIKNLYFSL